MSPLEILDPTVEPTETAAITYAPRPDSLAGKRLGLIEKPEPHLRLVARDGVLLDDDSGEGDSPPPGKG